MIENLKVLVLGYFMYTSYKIEDELVNQYKHFLGCLFSDTYLTLMVFQYTNLPYLQLQSHSCTFQPLPWLSVLEFAASSFKSVWNKYCFYV